MKVKDDGVQVYCIICDVFPADIPHRYGETNETGWYCRTCFKSHIQHCREMYD